MKIATFLLCAAALTCFSATAQQTLDPAPASVASTPTSTQAPIPVVSPSTTTKHSPDVITPSLEVILLKEQIKHIQEQNRSIESYHESVLTTSYFALGSAITLTVLLLGYSGWFNTRAYESDKKNLKEGLEKTIASAESRIAMKEQGQRSASEAAINARIDAAATANGTNYAQLRSELGEVRTTWEASSTQISERISWFTREFRMIEDLVWSQRGIHSNSLFALAQGLELCSIDDDDAFFDIVAKRFKHRATELKEANHKISSEGKVRIEQKLEALREKRPEKTRELVEAFNQIDVEVTS